MDNTTIIELAGLIIGTNGLTAFIVSLLTIRYERKKIKGEAHSAEYEGMKVEQDTYQELIIDLKDAWKEQKEYIGELTADRRNLRQERNELRKEIDDLKAEFRKERDKDDKEKKELREKIQLMSDKLARQGRIVKAMSPMICSNSKCKQRISDILGLVDDESFENNETV